MKYFKKLSVFLLIFIIYNYFPLAVYAANTPSFSQQITSGTLTVDIVNGSYASVSSPSLTFSSVTSSVICEISSGTLGTSSQKMYIANPGQADNGWVLSIAATGGPTATWNNLGAGSDYDFNDPLGCTDGGDTDSLAGKMTINPAVGTLTVGQCSSCATTGVSLGAPATFSEGTIDSITLVSATSGSDDVADYLLTNVNINQLIPIAQDIDNYQIDMTLTVTAI